MVVAGQGLPFDQMDEGSSSDGDDEGALEEHFELGLGGMDGNGVAGGAPVGGAAAAGQQQPVVQMSAAETLLRALTRRNTRARNRLRVPLSRPTGANIMLVKLISQVGDGVLRGWVGKAPEQRCGLPLQFHRLICCTCRRT